MVTAMESVEVFEMNDERRQVVGGAVRKLGVFLPSLVVWRQKRLRTQAELAEEASISRATVANAERGSRIAYASAEKLAAALGVSVAELEKAADA